MESRQRDVEAHVVGELSDAVVQCATRHVIGVRMSIDSASLGFIDHFQSKFRCLEGVGALQDGMFEGDPSGVGSDCTSDKA